MARITVNTVPSSTNVTVQDANNITANIQDGNNITVQVTPVAKQVIQVNRGVMGPSGNDNIGGYPVVITSAQNYDALMFLDNQWINNPQTEITDGGNY